MNKKHLAAATLVALAGLYLGCTNPSTVVDPRTPAGNAAGTSPTSSTTAPSKDNATGYWMVQRVEGTTTHNYGGSMVLKQAADGSLIGQFNGRTITASTNTGGKLHLTAQGLSQSNEAPTNAAEGTISDDGSTVTLSVVTPTGDSTKWLCTRLL